MVHLYFFAIRGKTYSHLMVTGMIGRRSNTGRSLHSPQDTRKRVGVRCAHCRTEEPRGRRRQILWLYLTVEILSNKGLEFVD